MKSSTTPDTAFLLDNCVLGKTHQLLRARGLACVTLAELGEATAANGRVLALAQTQRAILLTNDLGFGNLQEYPLGSHAGLIVLKLGKTDGTVVNEVLARLLDEVPLRHLTGCLVVVDSHKYRILRPPA